MLCLERGPYSDVVDWCAHSKVAIAAAACSAASPLQVIKLHTLSFVSASHSGACANIRAYRAQVPWGQLVEGRSEAAAKRRWLLMKHPVPGVRDMELQEVRWCGGGGSSGSSSCRLWCTVAKAAAAGGTDDRAANQCMLRGCMWDVALQGQRAPSACAPIHSACCALSSAL